MLSHAKSQTDDRTHEKISRMGQSCRRQCGVNRLFSSLFRGTFSLSRGSNSSGSHARGGAGENEESRRVPVPRYVNEATAGKSGMDEWREELEERCGSAEKVRDI